jgi:hypothetical protein
MPRLLEDGIIRYLETGLERVLETETGEDTGSAFDRLPEHYRAADALRGSPLERFMALTGSQLQEVQALSGRITDLVDPERADSSWLPWLAQLVGIDATGRTTPQLRELIAGAVGSHGSAGALAAAVKGELTGTQTAVIDRHYSGNPWRIAINTRHDETPDVAALLTAALAEKPAGVDLTHDWGVLSWSQYEALYPTWAAMESTAPTWADMEDGG